MKILLAEDDEVLLKIIEHRLLLTDEHQVITARNGKEARLLAEQHRPDLIITDMLMPLCSGGELINYVREYLKLPAYIIAMSAIGFDDFSNEALELGANEFVAKPFDLDQFVTSVESFISIAQAS